MRTSPPAGFLRLEALAVVVAAVALYFDRLRRVGVPRVPAGSGPLVRRLSRGTAHGRRSYNLAHTYAFPVALGAESLLADEHGGRCRWRSYGPAHIGIDLVLGYGLKYPTSFKNTHFAARLGT